jgi:hypothetical protein
MTDPFRGAALETKDTRVSRFAAVLLLAIALSACQTENTRAKSPAALVGSDRDVHGCIRSAGYSWCAREAACVRPWELASQKGFQLSAAEFERFCLSGAK